MELYKNSIFSFSSSKNIKYDIETLSNDKNEEMFLFNLASTSECVKAYDIDIEINMTIPVIDISGRWYPTCGFDRSLKSDWSKPVKSMTAVSAPVMCFYNENDINKVTFAFTEVRKEISMLCGIHEENGTLICKFKFAVPLKQLESGYSLKFLVLREEKKYWDALNRIRLWWEEEGYIPMNIPTIAKMPLYSFWYSYHQDISEAIVEKEIEDFKEIGFKTIIVDDGWQTSDNNRGYAFCGDWEPTTDKFLTLKSTLKWSMLQELNTLCGLVFHLSEKGQSVGIDFQVND